MPVNVYRTSRLIKLHFPGADQLLKAALKSVFHFCAVLPLQMLKHQILKASWMPAQRQRNLMVKFEFPAADAGSACSRNNLDFAPFV